MQPDTHQPNRGPRAASRARAAARPSQTRRARKKARTRSELLAAALDLLDRRSLESVVVEEICAAADVARGTFFLHFRGKAALLDALDRELSRSLRERLEARPGAVLAELRLIAETLISRPAHAHLLGTAGGGRTPRRERGAELRALVEAVVRRGIARGELRPDASPRLAAGSLLGACAAACAERATHASAAAARGQILQLLLHGLAAPKPRLKWRPGGAMPAR
jgi:AcrR family transcriptional regulator